MKNRLMNALAMCLCLGAGEVYAVQGITLNGFMTAGAVYSDTNVTTLGGSSAGGVVSQDGNITNSVGFSNDSRIGIQISAKVNPKIDVTGQLLARGREDNYSMKADWAFVTYHVSDPLALRGGKVKLTTFLISDYIEVGYAYPWIRPPQEVYSSNPISTMNGVDMLLRMNVGDFTFLFQPYYGTSQGAQALVPQEVVPGVPTLVPYFVVPRSYGDVVYADFTADRMAGINLSVGTDVFTVRAGYLQTLVSAPAFGVREDDVTFSSAGGTLDWHNVVLYGEYFQREIKGFANRAFPNQKGFYTTAGYRIGQFLPNVTYAKLDKNAQTGDLGTPVMQTSVTVGLRYELGAGAALKLEAQQIKPEESAPGVGTRGLLIGVPEDNKAMIYGVAIDVVF